MDIQAITAKSRDEKDFEPLLEAVPYAKFIGMQCLQLGDELIFKLPQNTENLGNPILPAIHGGVLGGFLEHAAILHLMLKMNVLQLPKTVDFSIDYLRAGRDQDLFASCEITRQGRRAANVAMQCWQTHKNEPIATARAHFLLSPVD